MGYPKIFHESRFDDATPVASTTATGYDVLNLLDWRPYTEWQPTALPATVTVDAASLAWEFTNTLDGWTGADVTLTANPTFLNVVSTATNPRIVSPTTVIDGKANRYITARIRRNAGTGWDSRSARYQTNRHISGTAYSKNIVDPTGGVPGSWVVAVWDMHDLSFGGDDWKKSTITGMEIHLGETTADEFDIDWIAVAPSLSADYALFWGHDFGTQGVTVEIRGSVDNFSADDNLVATTDPEGDGPLLLEFTSAQYRYWRFTITAGASSGNPTIGIAAIGAALEIPKYLREGFDPRGRMPKGRFNKSVTGQPLGRTVQYEEWSQSLTFELLTWAWVRATWEPAWEAHLRGEPFVFAWDSTSHATELALVTMDGGFKTPHKAGSVTDLMINLTGLLA
jgi:hypothetical protein